MEYFGPRYKLEVLPTNVDDHNPPEYLEALKRQVFENLRELPHAPGVQMREVSSKPLSRVLGINKDDDDDDPDNELDQRIRSESRPPHPLTLRNLPPAQRRRRGVGL
jgi:histone deacetylase 1/2